MKFTRSELASAIHFWGTAGSGGDALCLTREASLLVDVLANMDFAREAEVEISDASERGQLMAGWKAHDQQQSAAATVAAAGPDVPPPERSGMRA
jgi:hypothetical protein